MVQLVMFYENLIIVGDFRFYEIFITAGRACVLTLDIHATVNGFTKISGDFRSCIDNILTKNINERLFRTAVIDSV